MIDCSSIDSASSIVEAIVDGRAAVTVVHPAKVTARARISVIELPPGSHKTSDWQHGLVAVAVYYAVPTTETHQSTVRSKPGVDFWGFINGGTVRLEHASNTERDVVKLYRTSFTRDSVDVPKCSPSFGLYVDYTDIGRAQFNLDTVQDAIDSRLEIYRAMLHQRPIDSLAARPVDMLHLKTADSVLNDALAYRFMLTFLSNNAHAVMSATSHATNLSTWRRAEVALSQYRATHSMTENTHVFLSKLLGGTPDRVECNHALHVKLASDHIATMGGSDDVDMTEQKEQPSGEYMSSLVAWLPVGATVYKLPFECATDLIGRRDVVIHRGFVYVSEFQAASIVAERSKLQHIANQEKCREASRNGAFDGFFQVVDQIPSMYKKFLTDFKTHFGVTPQSVTSDLSAGEQATQKEQLSLIMSSTPACMTEMTSRAIVLKKPEHNKFKQRSSYYQFMLRMKAPMNLLKPLILAKVEVTYDAAVVKSEVRGITQSMLFEEKRAANPREGKSEFLPPCNWIINGGKNGSTSDITCPYARDLLADKPSMERDRKALATQSRLLCHRDWMTRAKWNPRERRDFADGPDQFTRTLMAQKRKQQFAASVKPRSEPLKRKAN
jgi:DNA primase large subunit